MSEITCIKCRKKFKPKGIMATSYCDHCGKENPNPNIKKKILLLALFLLMLPMAFAYYLGDFDNNNIIEITDYSACVSIVTTGNPTNCICDSKPCLCLDKDPYKDGKISVIDCQIIRDIIEGKANIINVNASLQTCISNVSINQTFNMYFYPETNTLVWNNFTFTMNNQNNLNITNYNNNNITSIFYNNISLAIYNNLTNSILVYNNLTLINYFNNSYLITNNHNLTLFIDNKNNVTVFNTNQNNINVTVYNSQNINSFFFQNSTYLFNNTYYNNWYVNNNYNNTWYNEFLNTFNNFFNFSSTLNNMNSVNYSAVCMSYVNQSQTQSHTVYVNVSNNNSCSYTDDSEVKVNMTCPTHTCPSIPSCPAYPNQNVVVFKNKEEYYYLSHGVTGRCLCEGCLIKLGEEINLILINKGLNPDYLKTLKMLGRLNYGVKR